MRKAAAFLVFISTAFAAGEPDFHIPFEKFKLQNGMRVVLSRDVTVPVVSVCMVYDVGARAEEKGRTGFAHLFEHMMLEGSANVRKGEHVKYVQTNGGQANGTAHPDYTDFFETMPSNKLSLALWLESDRMRSLTITAENLKDQQEAIGKERQQRLDDAAYNKALMEGWPGLVFRNFQSSHSLLGSLEDLQAANVDEASKFFRTYYAPNNAVLAIAGDFEPAEAKKLIEQYFGNIPSQPPPARLDITEPARTEGKTETIADPHARVPAVVIGWPAPPRHSEDWYAIGLLDDVLTAGRDSRLQLDLVRGKQSLLQVQARLGWPLAGFNDFKDPGEYATFALYKPNYSSQQIVDQIQQEVDRIGRRGVDEQELAKVKAALRLGNITELQSSAARARLLGQYELLDGKPEMLEQDSTNLSKVTSMQIQAAAKKYLTASRRDVLVIQPGPPPPAAPKEAVK